MNKSTKITLCLSRPLLTLGRSNGLVLSHHPFLNMTRRPCQSLFFLETGFLFHVAQTSSCGYLLLCSLLLFPHHSNLSLPLISHLIHERSKCILDTSHLNNVKIFLAMNRSRGLFLTAPFFSVSSLYFPVEPSRSSACASCTNKTTTTTKP